jgi:uncharacterized protein (TIRG00374 family)
MYIRQADLYFVGLSMFFGIMSHLSRAYRWGFLLQPLGYRPRFLNLVLTVLITYVSNLGIPRSGEVLRSTALRAYEKIPFEKSFGTVVMERLVDLILLLICVGIGFLLERDMVRSLFNSDANTGNKGLGVLIFLFIGLVFLYWTKHTKHPWGKKIQNFINGLISGITSIRNMPNAIWFWVHTFFIWAMYVLMFWVIKFSLPGADVLNLAAIFPAFIAGGLAMSATNGGIGLYPIAVAAVLSHYGLGYELALAYGWVMWTAQTLMVVFFGGLSFFILPIVNRNK